jgi:hypothetical protein
VVESSDDPNAVNLKRALTEWAARHDLPGGSDTVFDVALEILLGMATGRGSRLPWAMPGIVVGRWCERHFTTNTRRISRRPIFPLTC